MRLGFAALHGGEAAVGRWGGQAHLPIRQSAQEPNEGEPWSVHWMKIMEPTMTVIRRTETEWAKAMAMTPQAVRSKDRGRGKARSPSL